MEERTEITLKLHNMYMLWSLRVNKKLGSYFLVDLFIKQQDN